MADTIVVASSAYNLAGDRARRPDFLKSLIIGAIMAPSSSSIGASIVSGVRTSNAHRIRQFLRWSQTDSLFQEHVGVTSGTLSGTPELDQVVIKNHIPVEFGYSISALLGTFISRGQVPYWVLQHMVKYYPGQEYTYTYSYNTNTAKVTLLADGSVFSFVLADYSPDYLYLYVRYITGDGTIFWSIYRRGTGIPELDALFDTVPTGLIGTFYPPIPFRYENDPVSADSPDPALATIYPTCKKAFKKAFGVDFDDVREKVQDNPSIDNIDFIYAVLGVSFNTKENAGMKYIYRFFEYLLANTDNLSQEDEATWLARWESGASRPTPPWKSLRIESVRAGTSSYRYRTDIKWAFLHQATGTGPIPSGGGAKKGDFYIHTWGNPLSSVYTEDDGFNQRVTLWWQETDDTWRRLTITGLQYNNYVYTPEYTRVTAKSAVGLFGKDSEFLVPLHEGIYRSLPLVDQLQLGTSSSYLVFNCYEVDKEEWYESDWFKVVLVVVILAVSIIAAIFTGGASLGVAGAAVGGILGGTGLSAVAILIIAAAVDVLAALLISFLISELAVTIFGEEWGPLIASIVSFIFTFGLSVGSISEVLTALTKPDVWISLASATGNGVASYMQAEAKNIAENTAKMMEQYSAQAAEVQRKYDELQSGSSSGIDHSVVNRYILETSEKPGDFLKRTLATGSDIVEITLGQIESFAQINLKLVLP